MNSIPDNVPVAAVAIDYHGNWIFWRPGRSREEAFDRLNDWMSHNAREHARWQRTEWVERPHHPDFVRAGQGVRQAQYRRNRLVSVGAAIAEASHGGQKRAFGGLDVGEEER